MKGSNFKIKKDYLIVKEPNILVKITGFYKFLRTNSITFQPKFGRTDSDYFLPVRKLVSKTASANKELMIWWAEVSH